MKKSSICTAVILISVFILPAGAALTTEAIVEKFRGRMYSAGKVSGTISYTLKSGRTFSGVFKYLSPGNIHIQFSNPGGKILIANATAKKLWLYDPQSKVCAIQELDPGGGFSGGIAAFLKDYSAMALPETGEGYTIKFINEAREYSEITLVLDSSFFIKKGTLKNKQGTGFSFTLSGLNFSPDLVRTIFNFNAPANTQIVKNPFNLR